MRFTYTVLVMIFLSACSDKTSGSESGYADARPLFVKDASVPADAYVIDWSPPPPPEPEITREERCAQTSVEETQAYCACFPRCCDNQRWYCPPNPQQTIDVMQVVLEVCDENKVPCTFGEDPNCPPPEIIAQSECITQWECPPGTSGEFIRWFECQLEDGTMGRQQIICDKGSLRHLPCRPCEEESCDTEDNDCDDIIDEGLYPCENECGPGRGICRDGQVVECIGEDPGEERCNFEDDDCDGQIDEGQTNVCGTCGPVPPDVCNGIDDDCDGTVDEELIRECETACERGVETCQDGNWISCTATRPEEEICDGADNDCDGQIDEQLNCLCTIQDVGNLQPCNEPPLLCGQGFKTCECTDPTCTEFRMTDCQALCVYVPMPEPPPCDPRVGMTVEQEECNAFDEDCDEEIDEELTQPCYTGDPDTLLVGVCAPGEAYCNLGVWGSDVNGQFTPGICDGEVTPTDEICDGADNDCDGITDYGEQIRDTDILFIVDWSGSMDLEIEAVRIALNQFAQQFAAEEALQWGLAIGPKEMQPGIRSKEWLVKVADMMPFDQFLQAFAALGNEGMDTGNEMLMDAIYLAIQNITGAAALDIPAASWVSNTGSQPEKENFSITWRPNAERIVILFTDEGPQTYLNPPVTENILVNALRASLNLKFYAFVDAGWDGDEWEDIILAGRGERFRLTSNANDMYNDLMSIIDEACLPRENQVEEQDASQMSMSENDLYNPVLWVTQDDSGWAFDWAMSYSQYLDFESAMCIERRQ